MFFVGQLNIFCRNRFIITRERCVIVDFNSIKFTINIEVKSMEINKIEGKIALKYIGTASIALTGILYIVAGIILLIRNDYVFSVISYVVLGYTILMTISGIFSSFKNFSIIKLLLAFAPLIIGILLVVYPKQFSSLYAFFLGGYMLLLAVIKYIDFIILRANRTKGRYKVLFDAIIITGFALPLFMNASMNINRAFLITGIFCIFYGITVFGDFIDDITPIEKKDQIKKRIRVNMPVLFTSLLPKKAVSTINKLLTVDDDGILEEESFKVNQVPDMEVFIHVTEKGFGTIGHADIYFEGKVYCYGNYDHLSLKLFGAVGDGVLFTTTNRDRYINFCAKTTGDSIFAFGLKLTDAQKDSVRKSIEELFTHLIPWESVLCRYELGMYKSETMPDDYASKLFKETGANMYKFKDTSFKAYFVATTNCVKLADRLVRATGIATALPNGILSPGAYYDYFDRQYRMKNSIVISKQTYHHDARIEHIK